MQADRPWTWRVEHIPRGTTREQLKLFFIETDRSRIEVESLVPESITPDPFYHRVANRCLTATISFRAQEGRKPQLVDEFHGKIGLDGDFYGFTSLYSPEREPIAADVVAVTGLAGHAFGSWMHLRTHSRTLMWLRDYLPKEISNIRVLIYGYPSRLENSVSTISLFEHSNNLKERLLAMRRAAQCQQRPVIFIGHSLGCLIVKRVVVDANHSKASLPVRSFVFLGAPHRGLDITALQTLVQGTSSESMISELKEGSSVLEILDHDFEKYSRGANVQILSCYESYPTPTVEKSSDGSWRRNGDPVMMVTKTRARLGYEDNEIGVYSDHSQIAKIDIGTTGPFLSIKQAIDRALSGNDEQQGSQERSALHPSSDVQLHHSLSAATQSKKDERPTTGPTSGLAEQRSFSTSAVALERSRSPGVTQEETSSVTRTTAKSSRRHPERVGEDLPINRAIYDDNIAEVRRLSKGALLDKPDSQGYTPLMVAAAADQNQVVEDFMARGASLKISGPKGDTAFHLACKNAGVTVVSMFLRYAELLDIRGAEGRTPLMSSIQSSKADVAELLLDSTGDVEASDEDGKTALHYAAIAGKKEVARLLIVNHGADKNKMTKFGWTPLHCAAHSWHPQVIELLGMNGADCKALTSEQDGARSAIHLVLLKPGRTRCITLLIRYGATIEQPDGAGKTPLHWAAQHGAPDSVVWLLSKKANLEARTSDGKERTPLHIAVQFGRLDIAKTLLDHGANKDATTMKGNFLGWTSLHIDPVEELLNRKALFDPDLYSPFRSVKTPLMIATENESLEMMSLLLKAGAKVDGETWPKSRPLFTAVRKGNLSAVRKLLEYNAALETRHDAPLTVATEAGNIPIMKALLESGGRADVERTYSKLNPCLFIAAALGHADAVILLIAHGADPEIVIRVKRMEMKFPSRPRRAGDYFDDNLSEKDRRRVGEILSQHKHGSDGE